MNFTSDFICSHNTRKKQLTRRSALISVLFSLASFTSLAAEQAALDDIEVFTISHQRIALTETEQIAQGITIEVDLAHWLTSVPGGNINRNGPVTGIAQYRGLYGDRLATTLNGQTIIGAGPNAMDTPLSYAAPLMVDEMKVYRGIAPVSAGMNTLGGAINVNMRKAEVMPSSWQASGELQLGYRSNNQAKTLSGYINGGKGDIALLAYANVQSADDYQTGGGIDVVPSAYNKNQFGTDVRFDNGDVETGLSYHYTDTQDSGTPALPMDIETVFAHRLNFDGSSEVANWQLQWRIGYLDAVHEMNNFEMRSKANIEKYRRNTADATSVDFNFNAKKVIGDGQLTFGIDGYRADHNALITNPNNAMFAVLNFNNIIDARYGLYGEWQQQLADTAIQAGLRLKTAKLSADKVSNSMAMMSAPVKTLQDGFNGQDNDYQATNVDLALSAEQQLTGNISVYVGLGLKNRAPSYQELYLWLPMEATSGLADGHTYMGNTDLDSETAYQSDIGVNYHDKNANASLHLFYQYIDNYIQGTPLTMSELDMAASMVATNMSGDTNPLRFNNVEAQLYGFDFNAWYQLTTKISVTGIINYVEGKRKDINDHLYRVSPLNGQLGLQYFTNDWQVNLYFVANARKSKVSRTNGEQMTSGYALVNLDGVYDINQALVLRFGIDNLLDKNYQNHLGGYNRISEGDSEVPHMARLPGEGRSVWAELHLQF